MKMKHLLKKAFLLLALVGGVNSAWAETEVSPIGDSSNAQVNGTSFWINGTTNAGNGTKISPMSDKGIKVRKSTPLVMTVNDGYRINSVTAYAASNDNSKTFQIAKIEVDGVEYVPGGVTMPITCAQKNAAAATTIEITGIAATDNITFTFDGTGTQGIMEFHVDYTQTKVVTQEVTAVSINGSDISDDDLATLKTNNALTLDGSGLNGIGILNVTLSSGTTTVSRAFDGDNVVYTFSINNGADEYTVTFTNVVKTYTAQGSVVYYDGEALSNENKTLTIDGIAFNYASKTFGYANNTVGVTLGETTYKPIKLSTGEAVTVTFPDGKVAKKIIVYGWSNGGLGTGRLVKFGDGGEKSVDTNDDYFYANDVTGSVYPTVYEYNVDNWEAFTFQGNGDQPFVVMDFVLDDNVAITPANAMSTYVAPAKLDFSDVSGLKAYVATAAAGGTVTLEEVGAVPAGTPLMLVGTAGTEYTVPVAASASAPANNMFVAGDGTTEFDGTTYDYILYTDGKFYQIGSGTVAKNKAYLHCTVDPTSALGRSLTISYGDKLTGIDQVENVEVKSSLPVKRIVNGNLVIEKNGVSVNAAGAKLY